jgi:acyl dehydratase
MRGAATRNMDDIFFEDAIPGAAIRTAPYVLPEHELMSFAAAWDPMPIHIDKVFAASAAG